MKKQVMFFLQNAPLAILTSAMPGVVNYVIIIYLTFAYSMSDVGLYRILMSFFFLIGSFSFQESNKVQVRSVVLNEEKTSSILFLARTYALFIVIIIVAIYTILANSMNLDDVSGVYIVVSVLSCLYFPSELYIGYLQAKHKFNVLAVMVTIKYIVSFMVFGLLLYIISDIRVAILAQIAILTGINVLYYMILQGRGLIKDIKEVYRPSYLLGSKTVKESIVLSFANWLPSVLEHIDKLIIGYVFGMEVLGVYTFAFTTGRFIYNGLKPGFYIYYRRFVNVLPGKNVLWIVMGTFTAFGAMLAYAFSIFQGMEIYPEKIVGGENVVYIMFLSYGLAMVDSIYTQSYALNRNSKAINLLIANTISGIICIFLFVVGTLVTQGVAMVLFALHYPLRHLATIIVLSRIRR